MIVFHGLENYLRNYFTIQLRSCCIIFHQTNRHLQVNNEILFYFLFKISSYDIFQITGQPFWSGPKRCPKPLVFDHNVEQHLDFVLAAANLLAAVHGIEVNRDRDTIADIGKKLISRKKLAM